MQVMKDVKLGAVLEKAKTSRATAQARANLSRLRAELNAMRARHEPIEKVNGFEADGKSAILKALREASEQERAALASELDKERQRWERDYMSHFQENAFRLGNLERRLRGMGDAEVQGMVLETMTGRRTVEDPAELDALRSEARGRGIKVTVKGDDGKDALAYLADELGKAAEKKGLRRPWERTEAGADLVAQLRLTEPVNGGGIMAVDEKGRWFAESMTTLWEIELEKEAASEQA